MGRRSTVRRGGPPYGYSFSSPACAPVISRRAPTRMTTATWRPSGCEHLCCLRALPPQRPALDRHHEEAAELRQGERHLRRLGRLGAGKGTLRRGAVSSALHDNEATLDVSHKPPPPCGEGVSGVPQSRWLTTSLVEFLSSCYPATCLDVPLPSDGDGGAK